MLVDIDVEVEVVVVVVVDVAVVVEVVVSNVVRISGTSFSASAYSPQFT